MYLQRGFGIHTRILEELLLLEDSVERRAQLRYELSLALNSRSVVPLPTFENDSRSREARFVWCQYFKGPITGKGFTTVQKLFD